MLVSGTVDKYFMSSHLAMRTTELKISASLDLYIGERDKPSALVHIFKTDIGVLIFFSVIASVDEKQINFAVLTTEYSFGMTVEALDSIARERVRQYFSDGNKAHTSVTDIVKMDGNLKIR